MITYLKLKHDILGVIWSSLWNICVHAGYYTAADQMIARDIIVSFSIFSWLKYARIFGRKLGHDTYGLK